MKTINKFAVLLGCTMLFTGLHCTDFSATHAADVMTNNPNGGVRQRMQRFSSQSSTVTPTKEKVDRDEEIKRIAPISEASANFLSQKRTLDTLENAWKGYSKYIRWMYCRFYSQLKAQRTLVRDLESNLTPAE